LLISAFPHLAAASSFLISQPVSFYPSTNFKKLYLGENYEGL